VIQVASHTVLDPEWRLEQMSTPLTVTPQIVNNIECREAVWKAYFANDRASLEKLIPEEALQSTMVRKLGPTEQLSWLGPKGSPTAVQG